MIGTSPKFRYTTVKELTGVLLAIIASIVQVDCGTANQATTYRCDSAPNSCSEYSDLATIDGSTLAAIADACAKSGGTWAPGNCPTAGRLGGCRVIENQVIWYYPSQTHPTTAAVMAACTSIGGTFVAAP